ncbi:MAG: cellulase family glycosylhydrolase [Bryobacteraceae bacterium]
MRSSFFLFAALALAGSPIRLHPTNPHYYEFRGQPTILLTSGEHYGAVLNGRFNYVRYLDTLKADGLNLTRTFAGLYREVPGDFGITGNTLAPADAAFVSPYLRTAPGGKDKLGRFDLKKWNPAYWQRLKAFIEAAGQRGIVVELTLFCVFYQDRMWELSPLNSINNVNGVGSAPRGEALSMKHPDLVAVQEEFVRKVASELRGYDNLIYEICNEPYVTQTPDDWQRHMARVLHEAESALPARHLIGQNIANNTRKVLDPDTHVSFLNFHYARPPVAVAENYGLGRVIGLDETGFDGTLDAIYRMQAWDFLIAGGAHYNNLDYSFTVGHEDGSFLVPGAAPGGGSAALRKQLSKLSAYFRALPFVTMKPDPEFVIGGVPEGFSARTLAREGEVYAVYLHSGRVLPDMRPRYVYRTGKQQFPISVNLPAGTWKLEWWDPKTGKVERAVLEHAGGQAWVAPPEFTEDIALIARK